MATQLNIKDPDIVARAKRLEAQRRVPVTQVIRDAITRIEQDDASELDRAQRERDAKWNDALRQIDAIMGPAREQAAKLGMTSDHRWIYEDADGNPPW